MNLGSNHLPSPLEYRKWIIETFVNMQVYGAYTSTWGCCQIPQHIEDKTLLAFEVEIPR